MIRYRSSWNGKLIMQVEVARVKSKEILEDTIPEKVWRDATFADYQRIVTTPPDDESDENPIGFGT